MILLIKVKRFSFDAFMTDPLIILQYFDIISIFFQQFSISNEYSIAGVRLLPFI